jgi:hypothetical protein
MGSQGNDKSSGRGEGNLPGNGGPSRKRGALEMKEKKDSAKEALDAATFASFLFGPGGR